ncbi:MAG: DUF5680 domain-containing protein [Patescibacteria group bacterium]|jgi:hypothetical protein
MKPTIDEVKKFFFEAKLHGWAADVPSSSVPGKPGYKRITFKRGRFLLVDEWCTTGHSRMSAGTSTIFCDKEPVWFMSYTGFYEKVAIPFLKLALLRSYQAREFNGGRGPNDFEQKGMVYSNEVDLDDFENFQGCESVTRKGRGQKLLGEHHYYGVSLLRESD